MHIILSEGPQGPVGSGRSTIPGDTVLVTYRKVRRLGAGYFGEVWLEEDTALNRLCAAKYLNPDFLLANHNPFAEAQTMVSVEHENIVQVYSADTSGDRPVIRMEYLREGSVESVYEGKPVPVLDAVALLEEACRGIEFLHSKGVLHRDIKPANPLLDGPTRVKVSDFGLACHADSTTMAPPWSYTAHLPPESINAATGIEDFTGDVYALGVTAYRLFNGDDRFAEIRGYAESTPNAVFEATHHRNGSWQPYVHQALRNVLRKSVHQNKASRYASASKFRHALEKVRPAVSWRPGEDDRAWCGVSVDGRTKWKARLALLPNGAHRFRVEKQVGGNQWRNVSRHGLETMTQSDIEKHMESAFESIASTGR